MLLRAAWLPVNVDLLEELGDLVKSPRCDDIRAQEVGPSAPVGHAIQLGPDPLLLHICANTAGKQYNMATDDKQGKEGRWLLCTGHLRCATRHAPAATDRMRQCRGQRSRVPLAAATDERHGSHLGAERGASRSM